MTDPRDTAEEEAPEGLPEEVRDGNPAADDDKVDPPAEAPADPDE